MTRGGNIEEIEIPVDGSDNEDKKEQVEEG